MRPFMHPLEKNRIIIHLSTEMPMGGGERQLIYLYKGLKEKKVNQVIICAIGSKLEKYCQDHDYSYVSIQRRGGFSFKYAWELKNIVEKIVGEKFFAPTIHCHDAHAHTHAILADLFNFHRNPRPFVISRKVVPSRGKKWLNILKYNYPNIKKIICVSQAVADVCQDWILPNKASNPNKIAILHDTLILKDYLQPKVREPFNLNFTIGIIGSLIPVKDHALFLECAKKLLDTLTNSELNFWIIGEGQLREALENQASTLGIISHLNFLGFREDIPEILSQLDLLLVTSKNEGLCGTILQAMAAQVPVIAKNVGGIPEIIHHEETGFLAENIDDFAKYSLLLYENVELAKNISRAALSFVQSYDLSVYTEKLISIYKK